VKIRAVPSEDFTVAPDTVSLRDATYCAMRSRMRVQDLIDRGLDAEMVRGLKDYSDPSRSVELERDQAGEHDRMGDGGRATCARWRSAPTTSAW
jgi:hypothetical protein